jgi:hypothetical protein
MAAMLAGRGWPLVRLRNTLTRAVEPLPRALTWCGARALRALFAPPPYPLPSRRAVLTTGRGCGTGTRAGQPCTTMPTWAMRGTGAARGASVRRP